MQEVWVEKIREVEVEGDTSLQWVPEKIEFDLQKDLAINENDIVSEMVKQAHLAATYGTVAAELRTQLSRKEDFLKRVHGFLGQQFRKDAETKKERMTDKKVDELVYNSDDYQDALADLQMTRLNCLKTENWYRAVTSKKDLLVAISYRQNTEMKQV